MPVHAYLTVKAQKQGVIKGSCDQEGHAGEILVYEFRHEVEIPKDAHTGQPTGRRLHRPLAITKGFDRASPPLYQALCSGEPVPEATLKFYRIRGGAEEHYFTIKLENALVVAMRPTMPLCLDPKFASYEHLEEVSFAYQKIIWTHVVEGTEAGDDWKQSRSG
jgi:type VI secretion system secreted protein Hcp